MISYKLSVNNLFMKTETRELIIDYSKMLFAIIFNIVFFGTILYLIQKNDSNTKYLNTKKESVYIKK